MPQVTDDFDDITDPVVPEMLLPALRMFALKLRAMDGVNEDVVYTSAHSYFVEEGNLVFKVMGTDGRIWHRGTYPAGLWRGVVEVGVQQSEMVN